MFTSIPDTQPCSSSHCDFAPDPQFHALWTSDDAGWVLGVSTHTGRRVLALMDADNFSSHVMVDTGSTSMTCAIWVSETAVLLGFSDGCIWLGAIVQREGKIQFKMRLDCIEPPAARFNKMCGSIELIVTHETTTLDNATSGLFNHVAVE